MDRSINNTGASPPDCSYENVSRTMAAEFHAVTDPADQYKALCLGFHAFPKEFSCLLPDLEYGEITDSICICPTCVPGLWSLFPNSAHPLHMNQSLELSCDYRRPLAFIRSHLESIGDPQVSSARTQEIKLLKHHLQNFATLDRGNITQVEISEVGELIDRIFFAGCLAGVTITVGSPETHACLSEIAAVGYSLVNAEFPLGIIVINDKISPEVEHGVLSTLLHEMVHIFLSSYFCKGDNAGSHSCVDERTELCQYMYSRLVFLFDRALLLRPNHGTKDSKNEDGRDIRRRDLFKSSTYAGHGPLFQLVLGWVHDAVPKILGAEHPVKKTGNPGERFNVGGSPPSKCWGRYGESYRDMQSRMWVLGDREELSFEVETTRVLKKRKSGENGEDEWEQTKVAKRVRNP